MPPLACLSAEPVCSISLTLMLQGASLLQPARCPNFHPHSPITHLFELQEPDGIPLAHSFWIAGLQHMQEVSVCGCLLLCFLLLWVAEPTFPLDLP